MDNEEKIYFSVVIPVFNEEENVKLLYDQLIPVCKSFNRPFEIIFVDDGSKDQTLDRLNELINITIINFRKNFGQTAALDAGIKKAKGELIITIDGDLQNDPIDIPRLIKKMKEDDLDVVSGWRKDRQDSFNKKFVSRGANWLRKYIVHDNIQDSGCTLKVYKRECFNNLDLFGEMHRFVPALLRWRGFKIGELAVTHHERIHGNTKYDNKRILKGFLDMLAIWFWQKYSNRPIHLFGFAGLLMIFSGSTTLIILFILRLFDVISLTGKIWPLIGVFAILMGVQLFVTGLLADIAVKSYYKNGTKPYNIKEVIEK
jgi:glycosyltransferase involved in cell wall biosynthesis